MLPKQYYAGMFRPPPGQPPSAFVAAETTGEGTMSADATSADATSTDATSADANGADAKGADANPVGRLWCRLMCFAKDDDDGEWLLGWGGPKKEEGEWIDWTEPSTKEKPPPPSGVEGKTPPSGAAGGGRKRSRRDEARRRVVTEAPWTDVVRRLDELDVDDLDADAPLDLTSDEDLEAAVNEFDLKAALDVLGDATKRPSGANAEHENILAISRVCSLYSDDSVLLELKEERRLQDDSSVISNLSFDGDDAQTRAETKSLTSTTSNPQSA